MAKILFTCHPFGAHLYPHAPVIKQFEAQGHEVKLATPDKLAQTARDYGIQHVPAGRDWTADPAVRAGVARSLLAKGNDAFCRASFAHLARAARSMALDVLEIARDWRSDLIVTDIAEFGGSFAGEKLGIPVITSDNGLARLVHDLHGPVMRPILDEIRRDLGLGPEPEGAPSSFKTVLTPVPKQLLLPDLEIPGLVSFRHENPQPLDERLPHGAFESGETKVYAMFGSTGSTVPEWRPIFDNSIRTAIQAMAGGPYDVLISVGRGNVAKYADFEGLEDDLGGRAVPARGAKNVMVVAHTVQPLALERADVGLLHAGFGSLREALAGGTPALYMPNQTDQPSNARLLEANGLGLRLDPRAATPEDVAAKVQELVERHPEFSANIARFQEQMWGLPSLAELTEAVARALEVGDLEFRYWRRQLAGCRRQRLERRWRRLVRGRRLRRKRF
jgi:N-glycosyltransferase